MGRIKELLMDRLDNAGLSEEQEQKVMDYLMVEQTDLAIIHVLKETQNEQLKQALVNILAWKPNAFRQAQDLLNTIEKENSKMSEKHEAFFVVGILVGAFSAFCIFGLITCDRISPESATHLVIIRQNNVPIIVSKWGNFYLWDEKTKTSIRVDELTMSKMAAKVK